MSIWRQILILLHCLAYCLTFSIHASKPAYKQVQDWLAGQYSNVAQATRDARNKKPTAKDGGHEHVSCRIIHHSKESDVLIAQFWFAEGNSTSPFRYRHYRFLPDQSHRSARMQLLRPKPTSLKRLKQVAFCPTSYLPATNSDCEELPGCDIEWRYHREFLGRGYFIGHLVDGECRLPSQYDASEIITVKDELKLWSDRLWINDRVYSSSGQLLIGNRHNIPYKFQKIK